MPPDDDHDPLGLADEVPEQPMVIAWEALDATTYTTTLQQLAAWVDWLVDTYQPPTQVIPPCWYAHPAQLEDLGHLWTGWQITRHPLSGVGMIGLDWDTRRDHTFQRLRDNVATTGCNARTHNPPTPGVLRTNADGLRQHIEKAERDRTETDRERSRTATVTAILASAELRHNHASAALRQITNQPATATAEQRAQASRALRDMAATAVEQARTATESAATTPARTEPETQLGQARAALTTALAHGTQGADLVNLGRRWADALEAAVPAEKAVARAVASAAARASAAQRFAADPRHSDARHLLRGDGHDDPKP